MPCDAFAMKHGCYETWLLRNMVAKKHGCYETWLPRNKIQKSL